MIRVRRALLSVSDKTGLLDFARGLADLSVELLSTGGTARALRDAGLTVTDVAEVTGFPEMLDGRVKTLHPRIHGGLLAVRGHPEHERQLAAQGIAPIDLVAVNLYPFEATLARPDVTLAGGVPEIVGAVLATLAVGAEDTVIENIGRNVTSLPSPTEISTSG